MQSPRGIADFGGGGRAHREDESEYGIEEMTWHASTTDSAASGDEVSTYPTAYAPSSLR